MKRLMLYIIPAVFMAVVWTQCGKKEAVVAEVGNDEITKSQFLAEMIKFYGEKQNYQDIDLDRKKNVLNGIIKSKLKVMEARDLDLDNDPEVVNAVDNYRKRLIGNNYYEQIIIDRLVPQSAIDEYLKRQGVEMKATHILIGYKGSNVAKERTRDEAKLLADQVDKEAKSGKDFTELVLKYSDDPSAQNSKGVLQYFKWGQMVGPFQEAAWKMQPGEISDPVETQYGFHIIRLDDRREVPNYKPDMSRENILRVKRTLFQAKADSGRTIWEKHYNELKEQYRLQIDTTAIKDASKIIADRIKGEQITTDSFTPEEKKMLLAKWKGGSVTLQNLLNMYQDRLVRVLGRFRQANMLQREVENTASLEIVVKDAGKYDIPDNPEIKKQTAAFLDDRLMQTVEKREVVDKTTVSDEEAQKYYDENPNKFMKEEELELWQIFVKDEKLAKSIAAKVRAGSNFSALAKKYSEEKFSANKGGYVGFRTVNALGNVSQEAFKLGPNKIGGPIKNRSGWAVFKTGKKNEKTLKPFKDVENQARTNVRNDRVRENRIAWEQNLEKKYKVTINEEVLKQI